MLTDTNHAWDNSLDGLFKSMGQLLVISIRCNLKLCMQKQYSHSKNETLLLTETKEHTWIDPQCTSTPKQRRQLEFVSPYFREAEKDLFSQLLGTETRYVSPLTKSIAPVKLDYSIEEDEPYEH